MRRLEAALAQIQFARDYTHRLIAGLDDEDWFWQPAAGITHVAWQVGHLAMAEYRLALERIRGHREDDEQFISSEFLALFGKGSRPEADRSRFPSPAELRAIFDAVHRRVLDELPQFPEERLDEPPERPHALARSKYQSLLWASQHEMLHAGQIGLLRRLQGREPLW